MRVASTTSARRGAPLRGGREKKSFKVAVEEDKGATAPARAWIGRPLPRPSPRPRPRPRPVQTREPTRPDPDPDLSQPRTRFADFPFFKKFFFTFFFLRSHRSKKRVLLWTPKFSVMNFKILWSTKSNSTQIHRNIYLYFPVIIELSVKSYGLFIVFSPNLS